jgi:hypothetical protein
MGCSFGPREYLSYTAFFRRVLTLSSRKEWNLKSPKHPALSWYDLQKRLESAIFDVFLVLDCCQAAGAITKGSGSTMEVLAGCSREVTAVGPGMGRVIGSPFTHSLIKHLEERAMQPHGLLVAELQTFLSLDEVLEKQSPNHVVLAGHYNPIKLQPLLSKSELKKMKPLTSQPRKPELRAVLAVNFREDRLPEQEDFIQWLTSLCPRDVSGIQVQSVEIEASFDGCSTLAFVSMPLSMWAYLERSPGYWFVGFVKSRNNLMKQRNHVQKVRYSPQVNILYWLKVRFPDPSLRAKSKRPGEGYHKGRRSDQCAHSTIEHGEEGPRF